MPFLSTQHSPGMGTLEIWPAWDSRIQQCQIKPSCSCKSNSSMHKLSKTNWVGFSPFSSPWVKHLSLTLPGSCAAHAAHPHQPGSQRGKNITYLQPFLLTFSGHTQLFWMPTKVKTIRKCKVHRTSLQAFWWVCYIAIVIALTISRFGHTNAGMKWISRNFPRKTPAESQPIIWVSETFPCPKGHEKSFREA